MTVDITIQEIINEVDLIVQPNIIEVNITRTSGGGGVQTVTGTTVTGTATDRVVGVPNLSQTLAIDNKTDQIPITSNDGTSSVQIDNDGNLYLQSNFGGLKQILITEEGFTFQSNIRYDISGKGILMNTNSDGFGLPGLTTSQMNAIVLPTEGMIVWNTTETATYQYNGATWNALGGGAVDSVNGQTGVVVLDATDVGAEPTKGSDDNYVTDAQLVVIGNTSGTNSGNNATNSLYQPTEATFNGTNISLQKIAGTIYAAYTQTAIISFALDGVSVKGGFSSLKLTANGNAINMDASWKNVGSDVPIATNGLVHRFFFYREDSEVWYTVKVS
jgi:hypothetical protein